jgi:hypothetical protein
MLRDFAKNKQPAPANQAQMEPHDPAYPVAWLGIVRKDIEYQWGAGINAAGADKVLAYEKKVPTEGGAVLMQDGTVKQMTAEEFKAAPKATK